MLHFVFDVRDGASVKRPASPHGGEAGYLSSVESRDRGRARQDGEGWAQLMLSGGVLLDEIECT